MNRFYYSDYIKVQEEIGLSAYVWGKHGYMLPISANSFVAVSLLANAINEKVLYGKKFNRDLAETAVQMLIAEGMY